ncbi:DUF418 domain-containing protein [Pseudogracilibacillus auburnensis]|uniref:DUF418 domain-containing protein n=1 Tax=Pseudogracilibacillus auburnensis TaxID=1494959 RepID=UPI001A958D62|nr:DUF418 domain-containing protein [Pseudogracilibacillus auburnensis]MBO1002813.1 DUF418 domain-containing protein [Pseudogracilibacillus auburnensis]
MNKLHAIQQKDRLQHIDIARGIAILGILLVNMAHFSYPDLYLYMIGPDNFFSEGWGTADHITVKLLDIFVQMKFITMFSFLFGFGMIVMMDRAEEKEQKFVPIYMRRLFVLLLFGIIHAFFIWDGDILTDYALLGFILLLFRKRKPKTLLIWAIVLYALFALPLTISSVLPIQESEEMTEWQVELEVDSEKNAKQAIQTYGEGSFLEIAKQRIHDRIYYMSMNGMASFNPIVYFFANIPYFSMFLLGAYFAKRKVLHQPSEHRSLLKKVWFISLLIGLPTNILSGITENEAFILIGAPFLMLFYLLTVVLFLDFSWGKKILMPFAAVGRTAFTNYLMQSVIATTLFYHYGFGLYGKVYPFGGLFFSLGIFLFQLIISNWWVKHFRFGPFEWLWRTATYKKVAKFKC